MWKTLVLLSKMEGPLRIYWKNQQKMKVPVSRVANNNYSIRIQQHSTTISISTGALEFLLWHVTIPPIQPASAHEYERLRIFFFPSPRIALSQLSRPTLPTKTTLRGVSKTMLLHLDNSPGRDNLSARKKYWPNAIQHCLLTLRK